MTSDQQQRRRRAAQAFIERGWHTLLLGPKRLPLRNCEVCRASDYGRSNPKYVPHSGVIDCPHPPDVCHGHQAASLDLDHVLALMDRYPQANLGIAPGMSGLVVVDVDTNRRGAPVPEKFAKCSGIFDGWDVWALALQRYAATWQDTLMVGTPSGGVHIWYRLPTGLKVLSRSSKFGWLIDIKSDGAYIPAPGTVTDRGEYRRFGDRMNAAQAPDWLVHHLRITGHIPVPKPVPTFRYRAAPGGDRAAQDRLERIAENLVHAPSGTGHAALCTATTAAAFLVADGLIDEREARDNIADAGRARNRTEAEIATAWRSALAKAGARG